MRKSIFFILNILLCIIFLYGKADIVFAKQNTENELAFVIEKFLLSKNDKEDYPDWYIESENPKISWEENGTHTNEDTGDMEREGSIIITASGKEYYRLGARKEILPWTIEMRGDKFGVQNISFSPHGETWGSTSSGSDIPFIKSFALNKKLHLKYICTATSYGYMPASEYYILSSDSHKPVLLGFHMEEGSGGASECITLHYGVKLNIDGVKEIENSDDGWIQDKENLKILVEKPNQRRSNPDSAASDMPTGTEQVTMSDRAFLKLCIKGTAEEMRKALENGANPNAAKEFEWTALMEAAMHNPHAGVVKALLAAGANVNAQDANGWSALMVAAMHNPNPEVVAALLSAGADAHAVNSKGQNALWCARHPGGLRTKAIPNQAKRRAVNEKIVRLIGGKSL